MGCSACSICLGWSTINYAPHHAGMLCWCSSKVCQAHRCMSVWTADGCKWLLFSSCQGTAITAQCAGCARRVNLSKNAVLKSTCTFIYVIHHFPAPAHANYLSFSSTTGVQCCDSMRRCSLYTEQLVGRGHAFYVSGHAYAAAIAFWFAEVHKNHCIVAGDNTAAAAAAASGQSSSCATLHPDIWHQWCMQQKVSTGFMLWAVLIQLSNQTKEYQLSWCQCLELEGVHMELDGMQVDKK